MLNKISEKFHAWTNGWRVMILMIAEMLMMYPSKPDVLAWLTMLFGLLKWAFFLVTLGLVLVGLVRAAMNRFRKQAELARI